jgi:group I intron endonuclease
VSGKQYVGLSQDIRRRLNHHRHATSKTSLLARAIRKYGHAEFEFRVHAEAEFSELSALEQALIAELDCRRPKGYNLTEGGEGNVGWEMPNAVREKIRQKATGRKMTDEAKRKISEANASMWTPELRAQAAEHSRKKVMSEAGRAGVAAANRARPDDLKRKLGEHSRRHTGALSPSSKVVVVWPAGALTPMYFDSSTLAGAYFGYPPSRVSIYCNGKVQPKDGSAWAYA